MATIQRIEDIECWKKARALVSEIYRISEHGRSARDFGLKDQFRRAAISIMSNIAEGFERDGTKEFLQFLSTAKGSAGEARSQLYVALDAGYIDGTEHVKLNGLVTEISRMLHAFMNNLRECDLRGTKYRN